VDAVLEAVDAALEATATEDEVHSGPLDSSNSVENWNWPVTLSMSCRPYFASEVASNEPDGVHTKDLEFAIPVASVESVREFSAGPMRSIKEMLLGVVGCHSTVNGGQEGMF
jgi:hypothetical protein